MNRILAFVLIAFVSPAMAQSNPADRMDRLERDLQLIQKQLATGGEPAGDIPAAPNAQVGNARLGAQLSQIQEDLRKMHGQFEQMEFANKRTADALERLQKDSELRFQDIEKKLQPAPVAQAAEVPAAIQSPAAPATPVAPAVVESSAPKAVIKVEEAKQGATKAESPKHEAQKPEAPVVEAKPEVPVELPKPAGPRSFSNARDHYNHAFRLFNQTKYEEAAQYFSSFTKAFPKDVLIGNAYYWHGETFYIKNDYVRAADQFRQGFEALPEGPKAPDNLLKLAMSLSALKRKDDACVVLKQISAKFGASASAIAKKSQDEQKRLECN